MSRLPLLGGQTLDRTITNALMDPGDFEEEAGSVQNKICAQINEDPSSAQVISNRFMHSN